MALFGALVAITGTMARTTLKETPDFIDAKRRIKSSLEKTGLDPKQIDNNDILKQKTNLKTFISYFVIQCTGPVWLYFAYFYCGNILTEVFGYSPAEVIKHNFFISIGDVIGGILLTYLSYKIYPLKILRTTFYIFVIFLCFSPIIMQNLAPNYLMLIQLYLLLVIFQLRQFFINIFWYLNASRILALYLLYHVHLCISLRHLDLLI